MEKNLLHQQQQQQQQNQQQTPSDFTREENQFQQHPHNQNSPSSPPANILNFEPGILDLRVSQCILDRSNRPDDNNLEFWKNYVAEYFAPNAKNIWCLSSYGHCQRVDAIFHQAIWNCSICCRKPGRGFELPYELLPRLLQIYYESHSSEYMSVYMPLEYQNDAGQIILHYDKAVQVSNFGNLLIKREGQLRVVFNPDQKISSWEFCVRSHEELIPRNLIMSQVQKLANSVDNYTAKSSSSDLSIQDLQDFCKSCQKCSFDIAETLKGPGVTHLGYSTKYVRNLQISDIMNSMKELIDYSIKTGTGPRESLKNFGGNTALVPQPYKHRNAASTSENNNNQRFYGSRMGVQLGEPSRKDFGAPVNPAIRQDLKADNSSGGPTTSQQEQDFVNQFLVEEELQENLNEVQSPRKDQ